MQSSYAINITEEGLYGTKQIILNDCPVDYWLHVTIQLLQGTKVDM